MCKLRKGQTFESQNRIILREYSKQFTIIYQPIIKFRIQGTTIKNDTLWKTLTKFYGEALDFSQE